jgi:hypothetical protein
MKKEEIIAILKENKINFKDCEDCIVIRSCELSPDNFYDYNENEKPLIIDNKELEFLRDEFQVCILSCCGCCDCAGW